MLDTLYIPHAIFQKDLRGKTFSEQLIFFTPFDIDTLIYSYNITTHVGYQVVVYILIITFCEIFVG